MDVLKILSLSSKNLGTCIGSAWLENTSSSLLNSINPADGSTIAQVEQSNDEQLEQVIKASNEAFLIWRETPAPKRGELIRLIADKLREYKDALGTLVALEMGKSKQEGDGEVQEMIDMADFAVGQSRMLYGNTMHSERPNHRMYEQWHPLGVVGVLSAFNFPVAVWSWNAFIAAICGNTVIWRPSEKTPLCAIAVQKICAEVLAEHQYPNVFSLVISNDIPFAQRLVDDKRLPLISFTGSTKVGRDVSVQVAKRLAKPLLELSGNNAAIIDKSADLKHAIPAIVFGAVGTAGQRCTSLRRLLVHKTLYPQILESLKKAYSQIKIGDPTNPENHMGPLIDQAAVDAYQKAVDAVKEHKGNIIFGGNVIEGKGYFVEPTIVEADANWPIVNCETFAPILYVMAYEDLDHAIALNNQVDHGLSSAIFTQDIRVAEKFLSVSGSDCGIVNVNIGTSGAEIGGAFGGEKETGGGREAGSDAWKAYMRRQTNTINWGVDLPLAQGIKFDLGD